MAKTPDKPEPPPGPPEFSEEDIAKARNWFKKGQELAEKKNYDYAIECYINGLEFWPEAVEDGHKPCRAASLFRGGQKVGFMDQMKFKVTDKNLKRAMLNAEMLLSKDPQNPDYMEAVFKNAAKARFDKTVLWMGEIYADAAAREKKLNPARFECLREVYEELADQYTVTNPPIAIAALDKAVEALSRLSTVKPNDMAVLTAIRNVAGKLTILKGKYASAESFKDSVHDSESQRELRDRDRAVQTDERMDDLIASAEARYKAEPDNAIALNNFVELLCRREQEADEIRAIGLLVEAYKRLNEYRFKMRADDIRIKQLSRKFRDLKAAGDKEAILKHRQEQLRYGLAVFKERGQRYPTDLRIRYQYGVLLFDAGRYDDAIPTLQEARNDPKTRTHCNLYIGRCFYEKGYHGQAVELLTEAISQSEIPDDETGKKLHYWLGRAYEAAGQVPEALKTYGQLIQWDYNYGKGDVRKRIDNLRRPKGDPPAPTGS